MEDSDIYEDVDVPFVPRKAVGYGVSYLDFAVPAAMAIVFFFARKLLMTHVFEPLAYKLHGTTRDFSAKEHPKPIRRFLEESWFCLYYPFAFAWGAYLFFTSPWTFDIEWLFVGIPHWHNSPVSMWFYYYFSFAFYLEALVSLLFFEKPKKDHVEMVGHHVITISLIVLSWLSSFQRLGSVVLIIHDLTDVFLYWAKASHSLGIKVIPDILFVGFAVSFGACRLIWLPFYLVIPSVMSNVPFQCDFSSDYVARYDMYAAYPIEMSEWGFCAFRYCASPHYFNLIFLFLLCCLHVMWFIIVVRLVRTSIMSGVVEDDPREMDSELDLDAARKQD